jgi:methyl-accepting chemotaxis protein
MDTVVQRNAAQAEELSSTAQSLADQAQELQALVGLVRKSAERSAGAGRDVPLPLPNPATARQEHGSEPISPSKASHSSVAVPLVARSADRASRPDRRSPGAGGAGLHSEESSGPFPWQGPEPVPPHGGEPGLQNRVEVKNGVSHQTSGFEEF